MSLFLGLYMPIDEQDTTFTTYFCIAVRHFAMQEHASSSTWQVSHNAAKTSIERNSAIKMYTCLPNANKIGIVVLFRVRPYSGYGNQKPVFTWQ